MSTTTFPLSGIPFILESVERGVVRDFAGRVGEWAGVLALLTKFEDEEMLDNPRPEVLAGHKKALKRMLFFGSIIRMTSAHPDYPDKATALVVESTLRAARDKLAMWHGESLGEGEAEAILQKAFSES